MLAFLLYALIALIPLGTRITIATNVSFAAEYGLIFLYATDLVLVCVVLAGIYQFRKRLIESKEAKYLLVFLFFVAASIIVADFKLLAGYNADRLIGIGIAAIIIAQAVKEGIIKIENALKIIGITAIIESLIAIAQFIRQSYPGVATVVIDGAKIIRSYGTFPHPNVLAAFLLLGLCALYFLWLRRPSLWKFFGSLTTLRSDILIGVGIFIVSIGLLLTFSRTAWAIGAFITLAAFGYAVSRREYFAQGVRFGILIAAILAQIWYSFTPYVFPRLHIQRDEPAAVLRITYAKMAIAIIHPRPFGIGVGNQVSFAIANDFYRQFNLLQPWQWQPVHNLYLLIAAETGVLGLLAFLVCISKSLRNAIRFFNLESATVLAMGGALLLFGFMDHFLWTSVSGQLMLWLTIGLMMGLNKQDQRS